MQEIEQEIYNRTRKENFTAIPNRYLDKIKKTLSACQDAVCMLILRKTCGWHQSKVKLTTKQIIDGTGYSDRAIRYAKNGENGLLKTGLLVYKDGYYSINLYYNEIKLINNPVGNADILTDTPTISENTLLIENVDNIVDNPVDNSESLSQNVNENPEIIPLPVIAEKPIEINACAAEKSAKKPAGPLKGIPGVHLLDLKTNKQDSSEEKKNVCYRIVSETGMSYKAANALVSDYGEEYCKGKLLFVKEYRKTADINNPAGFFTACVKGNYEAPLKIRQKIASVLYWKRDGEENHKRFLEMQDEKKEIEEKESDRADKLSKLSPAEQESLRILALAEIEASGINTMFIFDATIRLKMLEIMETK